MSNLLLNSIKQKISNSSERSSKAFKNIFYSFGIKGLSILVQLILVPLTIHYLDSNRYGIWLAITSIVAWFGFFDIGFGNGLRNRFAESKAINDFSKIRSYVSTTYVSLTLLFGGVWLLFVIFNKFINWANLLNIASGLEKEISIVVFIVFSFFCLQMIFKIINTILLADQNPAKSSFILLLSQCLILLITFILTKFTDGSLIYLSIGLGVSPIIIMLIFSVYLFRNEYSQFSPSLKYFDKELVKDIFKLGYRFFYLQIAGVLIYNATNVIIINVLNPESVTIYNIAWKYFNICLMFSTIVFVPFWSAFTDAYKKLDYSWMIKVYNVLFKISISFIFLVCIMIITSNYFYDFWIGSGVIDVPISVSLIVGLYIIAKIFASFHFNILNGLGKLKIQLIVSSFGIIFTIPLSIFLGKKFGLPGIIFPAFLYDFISSIIYYVQVKLFLNKKSFGVWDK